VKMRELLVESGEASIGIGSEERCESMLEEDWVGMIGIEELKDALR